ncbi:hypothetical protein [Caballeronia sp. DA-9]|uniref:hypothetical protein n=1 Tax=Caballeronia sp. DA-9 TaxID=3436237 RepID=UPI003F678277
MNRQSSMRVVLTVIALHWGLVASAASSVSAEQTATTTAAAATATATRGGIHVVLDASESMCGFFHAQDPKRVMLTLLRKGVVLTDDQAGNQLYLLKQTSKHDANPLHDVVAAPPTIQATAENMSHAPNKSSCQPFSGVDSSMELIFNAKSPTRQAESMILVTDAQFDEPDRERFLDGFANWAQDALKGADAVYAGFAFANVPFDGRYFPVSDPDAKRRAAGYTLPQHARPLYIFWFARSSKHLAIIEDFVASLLPDDTAAQTRVQHLLPVLQTGMEPLRQPWSAMPGLGSLIKGKPQLDVSVYDKSRTQAMLRQCATVTVSASSVDVRANAKCHDGKAFFDGVTAVDVKAQLVSNSLIKTTVEGRPAGEDPVLLGTFKPSTATKPASFRLHSVFADDSRTTVSMNEHSIDSDLCPVTRAAPASGASPDGNACVAKLQGRTFQTDILVAQLVARQKRITADELEPLNNVTYRLTFTPRKP